MIFTTTVLSRALALTLSLSALSNASPASRRNLILRDSLHMRGVSVAIPSSPAATSTASSSTATSSSASSSAVSDSTDSSSTYRTAALNSINVMKQTWYSTDDGLWNKEWWNSANILTTVADFDQYFHNDVKDVTSVIYPTTLKQAPGKCPGCDGFANNFADDMGWWVLAWIQVYDAVSGYDSTGAVQYLKQAQDLFDNSLKPQWGKGPCNVGNLGGGIRWDITKPSLSSIETSLFMTAAAKLGNRVGKAGLKDNGYYKLATDVWTWFNTSGLIDPKTSLVYDHFNVKDNGNGNYDCTIDTNSWDIFTYNQGVPLDGLVELGWPNGNSNQWYDEADKMATAGIDHFTNIPGFPAGEFHESTGCDEAKGSCSGDIQQFKGVFGRNIMSVAMRQSGISADLKKTYSQFLETQAAAALKMDNKGGQFGVDLFKLDSDPTVQSTGSALDFIVGAAVVSQ